MGHRICAKSLEDALVFVHHGHAVTSNCLGKVQWGNGIWNIFMQVLESLHPSSGAWGWEKRWLILPKCPLADPGTCFVCSEPMHQSFLSRQVLLTHSGFRGGYGAKMKDYEMEEELINLSEVEGRQGCVSQAVLGHGDPSLPHVLSFLTIESKYCRNKSHRADFRASKCWLWWLVSLFNCKLPSSEKKSVQCGHTSCLKFRHYSYRP